MEVAMANAQESRPEEVVNPEAPVLPEPIDALTAVVDRIRQDATEAPEDYLRSTEVPGGGE